MKKIYIYWVFFLLSILWSIFIINIFVLNFSRDWYFDQVEDVTNRYIGLVFWAAVKGRDTPSDILKDRLTVAYKAYMLGKVEKLIVSGDNSNIYYNEPVVMQKYLLHLWVREDDIYLDYAWFDTYDSLYRARQIFGITSLTLFTQDFHLKRAIYIGKRMWMEVLWVETNLRSYTKRYYHSFREIFARVKAFIEVEITHPKPRFLGDPIEILTDEKIGKIKRDLLK